MNTLVFGGIIIGSEVRISLDANNSLGPHPSWNLDLTDSCGGGVLYRSRVYPSGVGTWSGPALGVSLSSRNLIETCSYHVSNFLKESLGKMRYKDWYTFLRLYAYWVGIQLTGFLPYCLRLGKEPGCLSGGGGQI